MARKKPKVVSITQAPPNIEKLRAMLDQIRQEQMKICTDLVAALNDPNTPEEDIPKLRLALLEESKCTTWIDPRTGKSMYDSGPPRSEYPVHFKEIAKSLASLKCSADSKRKLTETLRDLVAAMSR